MADLIVILEVFELLAPAEPQLGESVQAQHQWLAPAMAC